MAGQQTPKRVGEISFLWTLCFVNLFRVDFVMLQIVFIHKTDGKVQ